MKKIPFLLLGVAGLIWLLVHLLHGHVFLNIFTKSLPQGIYLRKDGGFKKNEYALTCLNQDVAAFGLERGYLQRGDCKTGIIPVGKIIKGVPGDTYFVDNKSLSINGENFAIEAKDSSGRPLKRFFPDGKNVLKQGEYLLLSDYVHDSWDSRYWGPVPVESLLKPWVTYGKK